MATATKSPPKKTAKPKKAKKEKAPLTPAEEALAFIVEEEKHVEVRAKEVVAAKQKLEEAKEILKGAKANHLEAVCDLQRAIKESTTPSLFNQATATPSTNGVHKPAENPDAWKSEPLSALRDLGGLTQADLDRIEAKTELRTMGDLSKWLTDDRHQWTDLPGIGEKKVEKLQDAMEAFWKKHPSATVATSSAIAEKTAEPTKPEKDLPAAEPVTA